MGRAGTRSPRQGPGPRRSAPPLHPPAPPRPEAGGGGRESRPVGCCPGAGRCSWAEAARCRQAGWPAGENFLKPAWRARVWSGCAEVGPVPAGMPVSFARLVGELPPPPSGRGSRLFPAPPPPRCCWEKGARRDSTCLSSRNARGSSLPYTEGEGSLGFGSLLLLAELGEFKLFKTDLAKCCVPTSAGKTHKTVQDRAFFSGGL